MSQAHVAETAAEAEFIEIDGSKGEGGGQIFRLSIGLSAVTGQPVLNHSVRANRPKPGLALQHLACVRAVQMLCKASVHGAALKSPRVAFTPTTIIDGGDYSVDIGSLGSCTLVVQAVLPVMMRATSPSTFAIDGGTHVNFAPPYQSLVHVILPVIRRFGVVVKCNCPSVSLYRNGAPPSRRGRLVLSVTPSNALSPLDLLELGRIVSVHCWCASDAACSVAAAAAASACTSAAAATFSGAAATSELIISDEVADAVHRPRSLSACIGLFVVSSTGCVIGADRMLLNMLPNGAEGAAQTTDGLSFVPNIVAEVHAAVRAGACVDHHTCDQLPLFMSLAAGPSRVRVQPLSDHARSACAVASQFTGAVFHVEHAENGSVVLSCTPSLKLTRIHELKSSGIVDDMKAQVSAAAAECRASASVALDHLRLFVGNLDWTCTDEDLHRHMECAGAVSSARVVLNESNGRSKGYGTVEMATKEDALHAIQTLNNSALKGRKIRVQLDQKK